MRHLVGYLTNRIRLMQSDAVKYRIVELSAHWELKKSTLEDQYRDHERDLTEFAKQVCCCDGAVTSEVVHRGPGAMHAIRFRSTDGLHADAWKMAVAQAARDHCVLTDEASYKFFESD